MRILKITAENLPFFERFLTEEERRRLEAKKASAFGAMAGMVPCGVLLFTVSVREAEVEKIYVDEAFRRRGVAAGLFEQIEKSVPGLYRIVCTYQENRSPAFDRFMESRRDFFFEQGSSPVYVVEKEEAGCLRLPGGNVRIGAFFGMETYEIRRFVKSTMGKKEDEISSLLTGHAWVEDACLCHWDGADMDACLLTERTAEGRLRLYFAFSGKNGGPAFLACVRSVFGLIRDGRFPAYEIVCRTDRSRKLFSKLLSDREPDGYLVTACKYF